MVASTKKALLKFLNMKVVKVYGALKKRLGKGRFEFNVDTPAEAMRALCANFPGLQKWFIDSEQDGVGYKVKVGKEQVGEDNIETLHYPWSEKEVFSITPVLTGSGRGWGRVLFGALLIGASFLIPGGWAIGTFGISAPLAIGSYVKGIGALMMLGGVAEMISPAPPMPDMKQAHTLQNFSFSGVTNTSQIGTPIAICYGRTFCGSSVISSGLDVDQMV
jgi:predicted phage tail protein